MTIFIHSALADVAEAKIHFEKGVALFNEADYEGALVEFKAAYKAQPHYKVEYNIGTSLFKLHRYVEAKKELEAYLSEGGEDVSEKDKFAVQGILYEMQSLIGSITVTCNVQGAMVFVNESEVGPCPFTQPLEVNLGEHDIEVMAEGYKPYKKTVTVTGGEAVSVDAILDVVVPPASPVVPQATEPPTIAAPKITKGYVSVEIDRGHGKSRKVYVDGVLAGKTPLYNLEVEPGEHKIAVEGSGPVSTYYETVHVASDQTVHVTAEMKYIYSRGAINFGATFFIIGGTMTLVSGLKYHYTAPYDEEGPDKEGWKYITIGYAAMTGVGLLAGVLGIGLYSRFLKKDTTLRDEYLLAPTKKLGIVPFAVTAGIALAVFVSAIVTGSLALSAHKEFEKQYWEDEDKWKPLEDKSHSLALATDILIGVGAAFAVAAIATAAHTDWKGVKGKGAESFEVAPAILPGGAGLFVTGSF